MGRMPRAPARLPRDVTLLRESKPPVATSTHHQRRQPACRHTWSVPTLRPAVPGAVGRPESNLDREGTAHRLDVDLLPVHEMRRRTARRRRARARLRLQKRDGPRCRVIRPARQHCERCEIASPRWEVEPRRPSHRLTKHREGQSIVQPAAGWMATHPHWLLQLIATSTKSWKLKLTS
jgi:hypothetical protein